MQNRGHSGKKGIIGIIGDRAKGNWGKNYEQKTDLMNFEPRRGFLAPGDQGGGKKAVIAIRETGGGNVSKACTSWGSPAPFPGGRQSKGKRL